MNQSAHPQAIGTRGVVHAYGDPVAGGYAKIATARFGTPLAMPGTDTTMVL